MHSLVWAFAGRTYHIVGNPMPWLILSRDMRFQQRGMYDQQRLRPACAYAQSDQSLCLSLECSMTLQLLNGHNLEFLRLKGGCRGPSESTLVKISHGWKSHVAAHNHIDGLLQFWLQFARFWNLLHLLGHSSNMHGQLSSGFRDKLSGLSFHLCPFILFVRSVETAQICRLAPDLSQIAYAI